MRIERGARIVLKNWLRLRQNERLLILTDSPHTQEAFVLQQEAEKLGAFVVTVIVPVSCPQKGELFDTMAQFLETNDAVIGATNYSLVTTRAVRRMIEAGSRYLSLPLSTNNGRSPLTFDFMSTKPDEAAALAACALPALAAADSVRVTTARGTDLTFGKRGRRAGIFCGAAAEPGGFGSSSFEIYMPIEEDRTAGFAVLDGSMGYIGAPAQPVDLLFREGRLARIEHNDTGLFLQDYMDRFCDPELFVAAELGIGLNRRSRCAGNCYIEDESAYGTFHIGMGRNLALGGSHDAQGHFDLVFHQPDIFADGVPIMRQGKFL